MLSFKKFRLGSFKLRSRPVTGFIPPIPRTPSFQPSVLAARGAPSARKALGFPQGCARARIRLIYEFALRAKIFEAWHLDLTP
jgi:hypothetical protein